MSLHPPNTQHQTYPSVLIQDYCNLNINPQCCNQCLRKPPTKENLGGTEYVYQLLWKVLSAYIQLKVSLLVRSLSSLVIQFFAVMKMSEVFFNESTTHTTLGLLVHNYFFSPLSFIHLKFHVLGCSMRRTSRPPKLMFVQY